MRHGRDFRAGDERRLSVLTRLSVELDATYPFSYCRTFPDYQVAWKGHAAKRVDIHRPAGRAHVVVPATP